MTQIRYVLVNVRTGEIEAAGSCDAQSFDAMCESDHRVKVIGTASSATHYYTPLGLQEYTPAQRLAKATPQPHSTWDNRLMRWVDVRPLDELRAERWASIKAARAAEADAPIDTPFGRFDACPSSRAALAAAVADAPVEWTTADNGMVSLDAEGLAEVLRLIGRRTQACHAVARGLRARIEAAATVEDLEAIHWPEGHAIRPVLPSAVPGAGPAP